MSKYDKQAIWKDLNEKGYTIIPNVIPSETCDEIVQELKSWVLSRQDDIFNSPLSLLNVPRVGHLEQVWKVRLLAKEAFAAVWDTEKLLTSFDKISIAPPPEQGSNDFDTGFSWLHVDRSGHRRGLHGFQGAVYLEETTESDHCLRLLEGSFQHTDDFFASHPAATEKSHPVDHYKLLPDELEWFESKGCQVKRVAAPKGSLVLWDTRMVHDNAKALVGRPNADRWRYIVFVCMLPAIWAYQKDLEIKRDAFEKMSLSCHMPCLKVRVHNTVNEDVPEDMKAIKELPDIAKTPEVKRLVGIEKYDFNDGNPNGPTERPNWEIDECDIYQ